MFDEKSEEGDSLKQQDTNIPADDGNHGNSNDDDNADNITNFSHEHLSVEELQDRLDRIRLRKHRIAQLRKDCVQHQERLLIPHVNRLRQEQQKCIEEYQSAIWKRQHLQEYLTLATTRWNVLDDVSFIRHAGPWATIQGARLGGAPPSLLPMAGTNGMNVDITATTSATTASSSVTGRGIRGTSNNNTAHPRRPFFWSTPVAPDPSSSSSTSTTMTSMSTTNAATNDSINTTSVPKGMLSLSNNQNIINNNSNSNNSSSASNLMSPVPSWQELNTALGHVTLLLQVLIDRCGWTLTHKLRPLGSTSQIGLVRPVPVQRSVLSNAGAFFFRGATMAEGGGDPTSTSTNHTKTMSEYGVNSSTLSSSSSSPPLPSAEMAPPVWYNLYFDDGNPPVLSSNASESTSSSSFNSSSSSPPPSVSPVHPSSNVGLPFGGLLLFGGKYHANAQAFNRFQIALEGLLECLLEILETQIQVVDKTMVFPHTIQRRQQQQQQQQQYHHHSHSSSHRNATESSHNPLEIGGVRLYYSRVVSSTTTSSNVNSNVVVTPTPTSEDFTRAGKYLLTNMKWLVAYAVKHHME